MRDDRLRASAPDGPIDERSSKAPAPLTLAAATPFFRTGAGAATLRQTPTTADISGTSLSILLWSHFVPLMTSGSTNLWRNGARPTASPPQVDHVNTADVPAAIAAEITAGQGHDIVEHIASLAQYEKSVLDMTDVVAGAQQPPRRAVADGDAQLVQPDHQCLLRALPWIRARPGQLPPLALGKSRDGGWSYDRGTTCWRVAPRSSRTGGPDGHRDVERADSRMAARPSSGPMAQRSRTRTRTSSSTPRRRSTPSST